jgi:hypothetical protein
MDLLTRDGQRLAAMIQWIKKRNIRPESFLADENATLEIEHHFGPSVQ